MLIFDTDIGIFTKLISHFSFTEQHCTNELDQLLKSSPKVAILLKGIQTLNKDALRRGITCRPCMGTNQEV